MRISIRSRSDRWRTMRLTHAARPKALHFPAKCHPRPKCFTSPRESVTRRENVTLGAKKVSHFFAKYYWRAKCFTSPRESLTWRKNTLHFSARRRHAPRNPRAPSAARVAKPNNPTPSGTWIHNRFAPFADKAPTAA